MRLAEDIQLKNLLLQIAQLMERVRTHKGSIKENLSPAVLEDLKRLEIAMKALQELNLRTFEGANLDLNQLKSTAIHSPTVPKEEKDFLRNTQAIEQEARRLQSLLSKQISETEPKSPQKTPRRKQMQDRRNRFKPLGGDKNWIPL